MKNTILFAIDHETQETIVSTSKKGSNKVDFEEKINRIDNELLFEAVAILTKITNTPGFDVNVFKAMDKVCELIYQKHTANR